MTSHSLESMVMNVNTVLGAGVVIVGAIFAGVMAWADVVNDIESNADNIEEIQVEHQEAFKDIKRGQLEHDKALALMTIRFGLLIQELKIRDVISETASGPVATEDEG